MTELRPTPSFDRTAFALICSALSVSFLLGAEGALAGGGLTLGVIAAVVAFMVAAPLALLLSIPAYLLLLKRPLGRWWTSAIWGGLVAAVPYPGYWLVVGIIDKLDKNDLLRLIPLAGELFLMGGVAGLVFHAIVTMRARSRV